MEGSRHEKSIITVASYVVGFTTAFILYGIQHDGISLNPSSFTSTNNQAAVGGAQQFQNTDQNVNQRFPNNDRVGDTDARPNSRLDTNGTRQRDAYGLPSASYRAGRLTISQPGVDERLVSIRVNTADTGAVNSEDRPGAHITIPNYALSADGQYLYYCEAYTDAAECRHLVYDIEASTIRPIVYNDEPLITSNELAEQISWQNGRLNIGDVYASINAGMPWRVN